MIDMRKIALSCLLIYLTICTYKDLTVTTSAEKEIPVTKVGLNTNIGPTLKFFYCYSCGYKKAFEEYANIIGQKYPELTIIGANYDPPGLSLIIARVLGVLKMLVIVSILSGINLFTKVGLQTPSWYIWCTNNRIWACMMIFFTANALEGHFISTGAFEIILNDMPVWSKLETGRIPQYPELFQIIDNHMRLTDMKDPGNFPK